MASSAATPPTGTAAPGAEPEESGQEQSLFLKENAKVPWSEDIWKAIHRTVHDESMRVRVGAKFLPHSRVHPKTTSVQQDMVLNAPLPGETPYSTLTIDEGTTIRLNEIWTEFALTTQQVHETAEAKNPEHTSAVTLARRAAQYLALGQDIVIFQGYNGYNAPFFSQNVRYRQPYQPADGGLLSLTGGPYSSASANPTITVPPLDSPPAVGVTYGQNTLTGVTEGITALTAQGQPGPYALALNTAIYADLYAAVGLGSLVITADRIDPLVKAGLFGTATIPPDPSGVTSPVGSPPSPPYYGVLVSLGGRTMELVVGLHATTVYMQQDLNQLWRFRVLERFALRVMDVTAIQVLEFTS